MTDCDYLHGRLCHDVQMWPQWWPSQDSSGGVTKLVKNDTVWGAKDTGYQLNTVDEENLKISQDT